MKHALILLALLSTCTAHAFTFTWTNTVGGNWSTATNWSPNAVPTPVDTANITTPGTYTITITNSGGVSLSNLNLGALSGTQTLIQGSISQLAVTNAGVISGGGVLTVTNGGLTGKITVGLTGAINFAGPSATVMPLYNLNLVNNGSVTWGACGLEFGPTSVSNYGTWVMTNDGTMDLGGSASVFINFGTFLKSAGTGNSTVSGIPFLNESGALISSLSGTIELLTGGNCLLGGTLNATIPGLVILGSSTWTEAGAVATGTGTNEFGSGTLNLVTNNVPGLKLTGGNIYITGTSTFQQAGAITNLTLDGAQLNGTNRVGSGALTLNTGGVAGQLTIAPAGQFNLATTPFKLLYNLNIINQGTVNWTAGTLNFGGTIISNGGSWISSSDTSISWGGGNEPIWTNAGTLRKSAGTGTTGLTGIIFTNQSSGVVEVDSGTLQLPIGTTNTAGTIYLNGGTLLPTGTFGFTGGTLQGSGTIGAINLAGGTITPGLSSPGVISFPSGLTLAPAATLVIAGTGTTPGVQYDQITVTGSTSLSNATLQVTSLPSAPVGTTFFIITNTGSSLVTGTFNGLAENALLDAGSQPFRIHYAAGPRANAVTLVRDAGLTLTNAITSGGNFTLNGAASGPGLYQVQASTNLINWTNLGTVTGNASGSFTFIDTNAYQFPYRFYRTTN
jgi:hypothetical protein